MNTVAESLVVNEGENGIWLVFWEIKELPGIPTDMIIATTTFQCALHFEQAIMTSWLSSSEVVVWILLFK